MRWHTRDRLTSEGKPCRWEGQILTFLDEQIHELGAFGDTIWNQRSVVEIPGANRGQGWFLHAMTSMEHLLRLVFRVARNGFDAKELEKRLGIKSLNETPGLEIYGTEPRVRASNLKKGPWQSVTLLVYKLEEIDTGAFRTFLKQAIDSFNLNVKRLQTKPEDVMPWKLNGERWHLGDKGFPIGKKVLWDRTLLRRMLDLMKEIEPGLEVKWDARDAITLKVPGIGRGWAQWRTKEPEGLVCRFLGQRGQFNLARIEGLGVEPVITGRDNGDVVKLTLRSLDAQQAQRLKELLGEHLEGFRAGK